MKTYRITWDRPHLELVLEAETDASVWDRLKKHPRGTTGVTVLRRDAFGESIPESEDGYRPGGQMPDTWAFVPQPR